MPRTTEADTERPTLLHTLYIYFILRSYEVLATEVFIQKAASNPTYKPCLTVLLTLILHILHNVLLLLVAHII